MADPSALNAPTTKAVLALSWLAEIILMWYCSTHTINGEDNASVTARYETFITPAGWAFAIWMLIGILQGAFVVYYCLQDTPNLSRGFVTLWLAMYRELFPGDVSAFPDTTGRYWFGKAVVPLELAWISVATIANVAMVLTDYGWDQHAAGALVTSVVVQAVAALLALLVLWTRHDLIFAAVFVWAFWAIRDHQDDHTVRAAATVFGVLVGCAMLVSICTGLYAPHGFTELP